MANLSLTVEIMAGRSIGTAASEICALANRIGINIRARFNDVVLIAQPNDDPDAIIRNYSTAMSMPGRPRVISSRNIEGTTHD